MATLKIGESGTVQFPMVDHAVEIGWAALTPQDAVYQRGGADGVFLRGVLVRKLREFNLHKEKTLLLEGVFKGLLHKLMTGEIGVNELDLSALEEQPSAEGVPA